MTLKKRHNKLTSGFKTPENYFESFDDKVLDQLHDPQEVHKVKNPGFNVPEDYFVNVEHNILAKLKPEPKVITFKPRPRLYYIAGIAASLILLFAILTNKNTSEDISAEMVETYFQNSDLDSYEIAQLLSEAEILEEDFVITETNYSEDNLESYLLENADLEQFIE